MDHCSVYPDWELGLPPIATAIAAASSPESDSGVRFTPNAVHPPPPYLPPFLSLCSVLASLCYVPPGHPHSPSLALPILRPAYSCSLQRKLKLKESLGERESSELFMNETRQPGYFIKR